MLLLLSGHDPRCILCHFAPPPPHPCRLGACSIAALRQHGSMCASEPKPARGIAVYPGPRRAARSAPAPLQRRCSSPPGHRRSPGSHPPPSRMLWPTPTAAAASAAALLRCGARACTQRGRTSGQTAAAVLRLSKRSMADRQRRYCSGHRGGSGGPVACPRCCGVVGAQPRLPVEDAASPFNSELFRAGWSCQVAVHRRESEWPENQSLRGKGQVTVEFIFR